MTEREPFIPPQALKITGEGLARMDEAQYGHFMEMLGRLGLQATPIDDAELENDDERSRRQLYLVGDRDIEQVGREQGLPPGTVSRGLNAFHREGMYYPATVRAILASRQQVGVHPLFFYPADFLQGPEAASIQSIGHDLEMGVGRGISPDEYSPALLDKIRFLREKAVLDIASLEPLLQNLRPGEISYVGEDTINAYKMICTVLLTRKDERESGLSE